MTAPAELRHAPSLVLDRAALRTARQAAGLSLRDVGRHIDRHFSTVGDYETDSTRGGHDVPGSVLGQLAGLYGVSVADFYRLEQAHERAAQTR